MSDELFGGRPNTKGFEPEHRFKGKEPIDVESIRAQAGVVPKPKAVRATVMPKTVPNRTPTVTQTQTRSVTVGDDDAAVKDYIREHGKELVDRLLALALDHDVKHNISLSAIGMLLDRGFGKPSQVTETTSTVADLTSLHLEALRKTVKP